MGYNGIRFPDEDADYASYCSHHFKLGETTGDYLNEISGNADLTTLEVNDRTATGVDGYGAEVDSASSSFGGIRSETRTTGNCPFKVSDPTSYTAECWVYVANPWSYTTTAVLMDMSSYCAIDFQNTSGTTLLPWVRFNHRQISNHLSTTSWTLTAFNTWTHLAFVYDGTDNEIRVYENNSLQETHTGTAAGFDPDTTGGTEFFFLGYGTGTAYSINAIIDEVAWWHNHEIDDFSEPASGRRDAILSGVGRGTGRGLRKDDSCGLIEPTVNEIYEINSWRYK